MGYLDTKRLMKQCRKIGAAQQAAQISPEPAAIVTIQESPVDEKENAMNASEFEKYLTEFLGVIRDSNRRYEAAVEAEARPNMATQDILHAIELAPSTVDFESLVPTLHQLRADRRVAKKELEVTTIVREWYLENEKAFNKLQQVLGNVRKILDRQPNDAYCWKTDVIGEKGGWLVVDTVDDHSRDECEQLTFGES